MVSDASNRKAAQKKAVAAAERGGMWELPIPEQINLGFDKAMQAKKTRDFSRGWKMRITLA
ncbi:hypothetical protein L195_g007349 [Trifolium pratense]|uniref:Uncharacterized protein n=1 Tax=Trifolium pratense TaxID=57577 RepID=A0A2K3P668_TRIPR|nr:hypothetical protein L195_g007349 [Trifolium pratense]